MAPSSSPRAAPPDRLLLSVRREGGAPGGWAARIDGRPVDTFEGPERSVAVLGSIREPGGDAYTAESLAGRGVLGREGVRSDAVTGCGLVVWWERDRPVVRAYRTLLGLPNLYFHARDDGVWLATSLPALLDAAGPFDPDPDAAPDHFTLRFTLPPRTYYRGVRSLPGGHLLTWEDGRLEHRRVKRLEPARDPAFRAIDAESLAWLDAEVGRVAARYTARAERRGRAPVTLLSGGVDSVLLQCWIDETGAVRAPVGPPARSCSFAVPDAPAFGHETVRARNAAARLDTEHAVVPVSADEYLGLVERAIRALARPTLFNEAWPCHLALAEGLADTWGPDLTLFGGNAADGLNGVPELKAVLRREHWGRVPGLVPALRLLAPLMQRLGEKGEALATAARLRREGHPLRDATALVSLAGELPLLREAFGDAAVRDVFDRRRGLAADAAPGAFAGPAAHRWERAQMVHLFATSTEPSAAVADLHATRGLDVAMLYRDEEVARSLTSFDPSVRLVAGGERGRAAGRPSDAIDLGPDAPPLKPLQTALLDRRGLDDLARVPKGGTSFWQDLWKWMKDGPLRDRVMAIRRPEFMSPAMFDRVRDRPSDFLWDLLIWDIWREQQRP